MTYAFKALPPGCILQSKAEAPRIRTQLLKNMKHVCGQFGHPAIHLLKIQMTWRRSLFLSHGPTIQVLRMQSLLNVYFVSKHCVILTQIKDDPGYRVLMKSDSGPGRIQRLPSYCKKLRLLFPSRPSEWSQIGTGCIRRKTSPSLQDSI